jgi:hypothetical protein
MTASRNPEATRPASVRRRHAAIALLVCCALLCCVSGCGRRDPSDPPMPQLPAPQAGAPRVDPAALAAPVWSAVLAAGDTTLHVDDDAVQELDERLQLAAVPVERIHLLSADKSVYEAGFEGAGAHGGRRSGRDDDDARVGVDEPEPDTERRLPGGIEPARPAMVLRALMALDRRHAGACFVYLGSVGDGQSLAMFNGEVTPDQVDRALGAGCGAMPTVVVVSACGAGQFAEPPMTRANRLILTASSGDRKGFGCGPNRALTTFDECFIGALDGAATWVDAFDRTRNCVVRREQLVGQPTVGPQSFVGGEVAALPAPWRDAVGPDGITHAIRFRQGIGRFSLDGAPYFPTLKARTRPDFESYQRAGAPKAMALTLSGTVVWVSSTRGETPEDVDRLALQRCEYRSAGACILYARDENLAGAGTSGVPPLHPPTLSRNGRLTASTAPFIRADQRQRIDRYLRMPEPKALAIGPDSEALGMASAASREEARAAALANCASEGGPCVIVADGDTIDLAPQSRP